MKRVISMVFALSSFSCVSETQQLSPSSNVKTGSSDVLDSPISTPHLNGDQIKLKLTTIKGYPFISGIVNDKSGLLLFDTGSPDSFCVNSDAIENTEARENGSGKFGSGQVVKTLIYPNIGVLKLSDSLFFKDIKNVRGLPLQLLEDNITKDLIGVIGIYFWDGYIAKLDYDHDEVSFIKKNKDSLALNLSLKNETLLQTIELTRTGSKGRSTRLSFPVKLGEISAVAEIDTGSHSSIDWNAADLKKLEKAGILVKKGSEGYVLNGMAIGGKSVPSMLIDVEVDNSTKDVSDITEHKIRLGYEFLSLFKTVWDIDENKLYLLEK